MTPPVKRDIGARYSQSEILAFLDDDAYPDNNWLDVALELFERHTDIACICGPAVTPETDTLRQKASGLVYASFLVSCGQNYRYIPKKERYVVDYPSCNFLIRKEIFDNVGRFNTPFWPGEDTVLCLKVLESGKRMLYNPQLLVYHHRRPLFKKHLNQIKNYALHRGYFCKKFPRTSFRWDYFIPSLFLAALLIGALCSGNTSIRTFYISVISLYLMIVGVTSFSLVAKAKEKFSNTAQLFILVFTGIILTHLLYGLYLLIGLSAHKMPEE